MVTSAICATVVFPSRVFSKLFNKKILGCVAHTDPGVLDEDGSLKGYSALVCS